jgi:hypothetical protein
MGLNAHLHLVPKLGMSGAKPPLLIRLHGMDREKVNFYKFNLIFALKNDVRLLVGKTRSFCFVSVQNFRSETVGIKMGLV